MSAVALIARMDPGEDIRKRRSALGWSQAKLAELANTTQQTVDRIESGQVSHSRATPGILRALDSGEHSAANNPPVEFEHADVPFLKRELAMNLPVMGTAAGAREGSFYFEGGPVDYVRRPPALTNTRGAYAIFVSGDSMEPAHPAGELRFVHPGKHPKRGDTVVIQLKRDGDVIEAYIKRLVGINKGKVIVDQINPPKTFEFAESEILYIHKVLSTAELFGV